MILMIRRFAVANSWCEEVCLCVLNGRDGFELDALIWNKRQIERCVLYVVGAKNNSHGILSYPSPVCPFSLRVYEWRINPRIALPVRNKWVEERWYGAPL